MELLPVRCFTCGKPLAQYQSQRRIRTEEEAEQFGLKIGDPYPNSPPGYEELLKDRVPIEEALDRLGIMRVCCRTRVMNPGVYPSEEFLSTRAERQYRVQPPEVQTKSVLTGISEPKRTSTLKPPSETARIKSISQIPQYRPKQITPKAEETAPRPQMSRSSQISPAPQLPQIEPTPFQPVQETVTRGKIVVAPLNLQGINLQTLSDIAIPDVEYL